MESTPQRLVNCRVAYLVTNRHGSRVEFSQGADGVPERALDLAREIDERHGGAFTVDGTIYRVAGIVITDVRTREQWPVSL